MIAPIRSARSARGSSVIFGRGACRSIGSCSIPHWLETAKLADVLLALPKFGRVKVNKLLTQCRISPSMTFGGLSLRQRDDLIKRL